jgi:parvulin-like peptidyl-prolyl isomerase
LLAKVDLNQRQALLDDGNAFREFVRQEAANVSLLAAARANNLENDADTQFLIRRNADNVLREVYLNKLVNSQLPAEFPNADQIKQYYETNKANLVVGERVSVWQIFLPLSQDMTPAAVVELEKEASRIEAEIKANKLEFSTAAVRYSKHQPSRLNGGYMGLLKVSELIPGIDKAVMDMDEGETSGVVRTDMGFHILRRGEIIPAQDVALEEIQDQIRTLMINQARTQLRNAITQKVNETYPVPVEDAMIEEWRLSLKSEEGGVRSEE